MKTFKDLKFEPHSLGRPGHYSAVLDFDNGYGVSVITGEMFYTDPAHPYELAVLFNGSITYNSGITDDVIGHLTSTDVTKIMKQVQSLQS